MSGTGSRILPYESGHYAAEGAGGLLQWWYFDAEFESGHRLMSISMPQMIGDVNDDANGPVPGVTFVIMDPEGNNHHSHAYYPGDFEGSRDAMSVRFGSNTIEGEGGDYDLSFRQGDVGFELSYRDTLPPWGPFQGRKGYMMKPALWTLAPGKYMH